MLWTKPYKMIDLKGLRYVICGSIKGGLSVINLKKFNCVQFYQKSHYSDNYNIIRLNNGSSLKSYGEVAFVSLDGLVNIWKINVQVNYDIFDYVNISI